MPHPRGENLIQLDISRWLRDIGWLVVKCQPGIGLPNGAPDLLAVHPQLPPLFIEVKSERGRLSRAQTAYHARLRARGFDVIVVRELCEVKEFLAK